MKDFVVREISEEAVVQDEEGADIQIRVTRHRNSNGYCSISVQFGKQRIDFCVDDLYETHARSLANMLDAVCDNRCELPANHPTD